MAMRVGALKRCSPTAARPALHSRSPACLEPDLLPAADSRRRAQAHLRSRCPSGSRPPGDLMKDDAIARLQAGRDKRKRPKAGGSSPGTPPRKILFPLSRFHDFGRGMNPRYVVKGLIPHGGLVVVWGRRNAASRSGRWTSPCMSRSAANIAATASAGPRRLPGAGRRSRLQGAPRCLRAPASSSPTTIRLSS